MMLKSRRSVLGGMLSYSLAACTVPDHLVDVPLANRGGVSGASVRRHKIMIATTRASSQEEGVFFSGARSAKLNFASVEVTVPSGHKSGHVERPHRLPPDPNLHFTIQNPEQMDSATFRDHIFRDLRRRPEPKRKLMIWVHGYNTTLTDALLHLAQFVEDTGYSGIPLLYSWASAGKVTRYVYDINSALSARDGLAAIGEALIDSPAESIDLVAHSMGNLLTMETIRSQERSNLFNSSGKLSNIILASPDIDLHLFASQLRTLPRQDRGFYILVSSDDQALRLSSLIASGERVGQASPDQLTALGVNVIDLSQVEDDSSNHHSKFTDAPEVVQLIGNRLLAGDTYADSSANGLGEAIFVGANGVLRILE